MELEFDPDWHIYRYKGDVVPSVTTIIKAAGLIDFGHIDQDVLGRAASFGSAVHQATALDDEGDLDWDTLDDALKPYVEAWREFRGDQKWTAIEMPLVHPDLGFSGTPDRVGDKTIIDIKTGTTIPAWTGLQLSGYSILAGIPAAKRIAVQLKPDGKFAVREFKDRKDREIFLACLSIYKWRQSHA